VRNPASATLFIALILMIDPVYGQSDPEARLNAIELLLEADQPRQARSALAEARAHLQGALSETKQRATLLQARIDADTGQFEDALNSVRELLQQPAELTPKHLLESHALAARLYLAGKNPEPGFEHLLEALALAARVRESSSRAAVWIMAAEVHLDIGETETALHFVSMVLDGLEIQDLWHLQCRALIARARALMMNGEPDRALEELQRASRSCDDAGLPLRLAEINLIRGRALQRTGRLQPAREALENAMLAYGQANHRAGEAAAATKLAGLRMTIEDEGGAAALAETLLSDSDRLEDPLLRAAILDLAAELAVRNGDLASASAHRRQEVELLREGHLQRQRMRLALLQSGQRSQQQTLTLEMLHSRNEMLELDQATRKQNLLSIGFTSGGSALAALLLGALLVKSGRDRKWLQQMSRRDGLTGLYTHTHFFELGEQMFERARQREQPLTLILADADHFKQINDEFGHLAGDRLLERLGRAFRESFKNGAVIGRLGGEEFGVLLENSDLDTTLARIERLRSAVGAMPSDEPRVTLSFGIAELAGQQGLETMFAQADQALYDAKDGGRNRVVTVARVFQNFPGNSSLLT